jgi:hypothetical protein
MTQIDINHVLGKLFQALASNRITARRATSLAYIAYLISQSQKAASTEARNWDENKDVYQRWADLKDPILTKQNAALYEEFLQYKAAKAQSAAAAKPKAAAATASAPNSISAPTPATDSPAADSLSHSLANLPTESLTIS